LPLKEGAHFKKTTLLEIYEISEVKWEKMFQSPFGPLGHIDSLFCTEEQISAFSGQYAEYLLNDEYTLLFFFERYDGEACVGYVEHETGRWQVVRILNKKSYLWKKRNKRIVIPVYH